MPINKHCHFIHGPSSVSQVKQKKNIYTNSNDHDRSLYSESSCYGSSIHKQLPSQSTMKDNYSKLNLCYEGEMMKGMKKKSRTLLLPKKFGHFTKLKKRNHDFDKYMEQRKSQSLDSTVKELKTRIDNLNEILTAKLPILSLKCSPVKIYSSHEFNDKPEELIEEIQPVIENESIIKKIRLHDKYIIHFFLAIFIIATITLSLIIINEQTEIFSNFFNPQSKKNSKRTFSLFKQTYIIPEKNLWEKIVEMTTKLMNFS